MSKLIPHWTPTWASLLAKEWERRMEPSWRISVHRCCNSVNSLLEVICWKVSYLFILISRLLADPSHTALLWGCLGVSLYHWESTQPFLISIITGRESLTSVWCSEGLTWAPLVRVCPCCIQLLNRWGWAKPPGTGFRLGQAGQSKLSAFTELPLRFQHWWMAKRGHLSPDSWAETTGVIS